MYLFSKQLFTTVIVRIIHTLLTICSFYCNVNLYSYVCFSAISSIPLAWAYYVCLVEVITMFTVLWVVSYGCDTYFLNVLQNARGNTLYQIQSFQNAITVFIRQRSWVTFCNEKCQWHCNLSCQNLCFLNQYIHFLNLFE